MLKVRLPTTALIKWTRILLEKYANIGFFVYKPYFLIFKIKTKLNILKPIINWCIKPEHKWFSSLKLQQVFNLLDSIIQSKCKWKNLRQKWCIHVTIKKSRMRETKNLSTDAGSITDTILKRLHDLSQKPFFLER